MGLRLRRILIEVLVVLSFLAAAPSNADINKDGRPDVLWHNPTSGEVSVWLMNGATVTGAVPLSWKCNYASTCARDWVIVGTGDFDYDGQNDVLWYNQYTGEVSAWLMNGATVKTNRILDWRCDAKSGCSRDWKLVGTGDFSHDGRVDVLWHNATTGEVSVWVLNGTAVSATPLTWKCGAQGNTCSRDWIVVATGDFAKDGNTDVLWHNAYTGELLIGA